MKTYHFMSLTTGELVTDLKSVLKTTLSDLRKFHILNIWKYSRKGF